MSSKFVHKYPSIVFLPLPHKNVLLLLLIICGRLSGNLHFVGVGGLSLLETVLLYLLLENFFAKYCCCHW